MSNETPDPVSGFVTANAMGRGSTPSAEQAAPPGVGLRLGRYTTIRLLGRGGMAEVYLAKQDGPAGFQKTCVIKRMRKVLAEEPRFIEMFLREARIAARLNHANVVQIFELGQEQDEYFIAMEYLDGISLHKAARRCWSNGTSMPMEVILRAVADAALGLHHAHTRRDDDGQPAPLVHRDVSPDNLVVTRDGITKVLDFGIAKAHNEVDDVTKTGELKGKIPYMSPEQIRGDALDGRSDLWSLGVSLYWLLTGQRPFDGGTDHMTIDHILRRKPVPPRELNGLIPLGLENVILSLLQKDPEHRMKSGVELRERLVSLLGPAAGPGAASSFCNRVMDMPATEKRVGPTSVLTIIAARPETRWLRHVSESGEHEDLLSLVPESGRERVAPPPDDIEFDIDTAGTVTNVTGQNLVVTEPANGRFGPIAAGAGLLVALAIGGLWLLTNDDDAPRTVPVTASRDATTAPSVVKVEPKPPAAPVEAAPADTKAPPEETKTAEAAPPVADPAPTSPTKAQKAAAPVTKRSRGIRVQARAPSNVTWRTTKGKRLGKGNASFNAPSGTTSLLAVDAATGGKSTVRVQNGKADYSTVRTGQLMLRIRPWAKASLGGRKLGTTPMDAVKLKAGRYRVKLTWNDKITTETVTIRPGRQSVLKIDMRKK